MYREPTVKGNQINGLDLEDEINFQLEQNEETRIENNEEKLRNLQDNFKHSNIWIIGVPEGEEEEQEIENLFQCLFSACMFEKMSSSRVSSLSITVFLALKSSLSEINIATPAFF